MFGVGPDIGISALLPWVAAGSAALVVLLCTLAFNWTQTRTVARVGVVLVGAMLCAALASAFVTVASISEQSAERRSLEMQAAGLSAQALAPGSPLACLDGAAGETVEAACEKALFATPATVATASSYVAARLTLLADIAAYAKRGGAGIDPTLQPLRHALEADRFGFVAHMLSVRDGCTADHCRTLALLDDPSRVRANLGARMFDRYLANYVTAWAAGTPLADASAPTSSLPGAPGPRKLVDIDFPSASSIPAVSIMNPEPKGPPGATAAAAVAAGAPNAHDAANASSRRTRKQSGPPPAQAAAVAPVAPAQTLVPAIEPVWTPGTAPFVPPAAAAATAPPTQLNPRPPEPQASVGAPARTQ